MPTSTDDSKPRRKPTRLPKQKIPRPPNEFILYRKALLAERKRGLPKSQRQSEFSTLAGREWGALTEEEKAPWRLQATVAKGIHREAYPDYKYTPRRSASHPPKNKKKAKKTVLEDDVASPPSPQQRKSPNARQQRSSPYARPQQPTTPYARPQHSTPYARPQHTTPYARLQHTTLNTLPQPESPNAQLQPDSPNSQQQLQSPYTQGDGSSGLRCPPALALWGSAHMVELGRLMLDPIVDNPFTFPDIQRRDRSRSRSASTSTNGLEQARGQMFPESSQPPPLGHAQMYLPYVTPNHGVTVDSLHLGMENIDTSPQLQYQYSCVNNISNPNMGVPARQSISPFESPLIRTPVYQLPSPELAPPAWDQFPTQTAWRSDWGPSIPNTTAAHDVLVNIDPVLQPNGFPCDASFGAPEQPTQKRGFDNLSDYWKETPVDLTKSPSTN